MADYITKARYWMAILYPENMIDDWQIRIADLLQVPFCYIIHDKDFRSDSTTRKVHVHIMIALNNTTTYRTALSIFKTLNHSSRPSCIPNDEIRQIRNIRSVYQYFIHDTPDCKELGKHLYDKSERICGNCFDIGAYEQLGLEEKEKILQELTDYILNNHISNFAVLVSAVRDNFEDYYMGVLRSNNGFLERLTRGMYQVEKEKRSEVQKVDTTTKKKVTCDGNTK